ncbi:hypothetical protein ACOMHN_045956 [Nucella lapillus]
MSVSAEMDIAANPVKRRLAFQKTYSQEMGGWRRRSLIDDAKFETVANQEFEKRERNLSHSEIPEIDDVFAQNGSYATSPKAEDQIVSSFIIKLKEGLGSSSRLLRLFENCYMDNKNNDKQNQLTSMEQISENRWIL